MEPTAKKQKYCVKFGYVEDQDRGDNIMKECIDQNDDYYWLRSDKRDDKQVNDHLKQENTYTQDIMKDTKDLQEVIYEEIKSRVQETYDSYPHKYPSTHIDIQNRYKYFNRTIEGKSYNIYCRLDTDTNEEIILLDVNELADGKSNYNLSSFQISNDHKIMSYGVDEQGDEKYDIYFVDIDTRKTHDKVLKQIPYSDYELAPDDRTIYYSMGDKANRIYQIWRTYLDSDEQEMIYQEDDTLFSVGCNFSKTGRYFFISASSSNTTEEWFMDTYSKDKTMKLIQKRQNKLQYSTSVHEDNFIITTNKDGATNFKVMWTPISNYSIENWNDIREYNSNEFIQGCSTLKNHLIVNIKKNGLNEIAIVDYINKCYSSEWRLIKMNEEVYNIGSSSNCIYDNDKLGYSYCSMTQPLSLWEFDLNTENTILLRQKEVPNYDKNLYESKRFMVPSYYGIKVPMSMVYRKDKLSSKQPLYLYAYGAYGMCIEPNFNSQIISLLDRGFIYVIAHIRGSSTMGYDYYLDGKMYNKMNTFLDFITCAEYLIKEGYTSSDQIVIDGRSAGGLTVCGAMVLRPDLFKTVIGGVPFVDVLTTMCDPSIPLTTPEWEEWGNPNKVQDFTYMKQYSPMDNIRKTDYPNTLFLAGLNDPRVQYWEPSKLLCKLREYKTDDNLHLIKVEMDEGHFGGSDRYRYMKETSFIYSFVLKTFSL
jgi:oligopeptidase B